MRYAPRIIAAAAAVLPLACSLFVGLDGLQGGAASNEAGTSDASSDVALADAADAGPTDSGPPVDAGTWRFLTTDAVTLGSSPVTVTSSANVEVGDLVIFACDTGGNGGNITASGFPVTSLSLSTVGPHSDNKDYEAWVAWGVVTAPITPTLQITGTTENSVPFLDCYLDVYRGGNPATASLVAEVPNIGPDDSGLAQCGPIATAPGGVAFYVAARTSCLGTPLDPVFVQRQEINGNVCGDSVPNDGGNVDTKLGDCNNSTSDWVCLTVSIAP